MAHLSRHLVYFDIEISPLMNMEGVASSHTRNTLQACPHRRPTTSQSVRILLLVKNTSTHGFH